MKQYIYDLMRDKRNDLTSEIVKSFLLVISYFYGFLVRCHHFFYKVNLLKSYKPQIGVVSVGNITLGGTGKTPFAVMLAEELAEKGIKTAILIRGYGRDECKMLEGKLGKKGIKIFVGRDRVDSAKKAERGAIDNLILDDGFQHRPLKRDLDIVLIDSRNPFGNRHIFPRGILREPLASLKRADIIVLTKVDKENPNTSKLTDEIKRIAPGKMVMESVHSPKDLYEVWKGTGYELETLNGKTVCILSAICDPSYFRHTVERAGSSIGLEFVFPDHYLYKTEDLNHIFRACKGKNIETIVTTEKDAVKLKNLTPIKSAFSSQILALAVKLEIVQGREGLDASLHRLHMRYSA